MAEEKRLEGLPEPPPEIYVAEERRKINWKRIFFIFLGIAFFLWNLLFTTMA